MKKLILVACLLGGNFSFGQQLSYQIKNKQLSSNKGDVISTSVDSTSVFANNEKIYFLELLPQSKIASYNPATTVREDLLSIGMKSLDGNIVKGEIVKMLPDAAQEKVFFSTKDIYNNEIVYLTWQYTIQSGELGVLTDGKLLSIDKGGIVKVDMAGRDMTGAYSQEAYYDTRTKKMIKIEERKYGSQ